MAWSKRPQQGGYSNSGNGEQKQFSPAEKAIYFLKLAIGEGAEITIKQNGAVAQKQAAAPAKAPAKAVNAASLSGIINIAEAEKEAYSDAVKMICAGLGIDFNMENRIKLRDSVFKTKLGEKTYFAKVVGDPNAALELAKAELLGKQEDEGEPC